VKNSLGVVGRCENKGKSNDKCKCDRSGRYVLRTSLRLRQGGVAFGVAVFRRAEALRFRSECVGFGLELESNDNGESWLMPRDEWGTRLRRPRGGAYMQGCRGESIADCEGFMAQPDYECQDQAGG